MNDQRLRDLEQRMNDLVQRVTNLPDRLARHGGGGRLPRIRIDGAATEITENQWDYAWTLMRWDPVAGEWEETETTSESAGFAKARNSLEDNNPADLTVASGKLAIGLTLPISDGVMMPFGGTEGQEAIVPCEFFPVQVTEGETTVTKKRPIFCEPNSFDCV